MKTRVKKTTLAILPLAGWLFAAPVVFADDRTTARPDLQAAQKPAQPELKAKPKAAPQEQLVALGLVLLLFGAPRALVAAPPQEHAMTKELQKFQGTWVMVEGEVDGQKIAEAQVKPSTMTFAQDKVTVDSPQLSTDMVRAILTKVDPTKTPREMHWIRTTGPSAGKLIRAIYEFAGDDQFKICFDPSGKGAPTAFATTEKTGYILHIWKRGKQ
ncbi:MAG TPA: TIGR03067 domain-containing protein [Candidatus Binatia bacterium]|jgi:uncharacterized protein (TIGR03067 family)|nr:TIGR03067 domain-containing protein [Candidatus Binatia bacterium]